MKYLCSFKSFNEGLFTTNESDDQIAIEILTKINSLNFPIEMIGHYQFTADNIKLDDNPGTYNISVSKMEIKIEYYKEGKLQFKSILNCDSSIKNKMYQAFQNKYIANGVKQH
jgi:hypothetical protein